MTDATNPWLERRPLPTAHRGGGLEVPENTLHAFRYAVACGARMLELDLHTTDDGGIVVIHDRTLDRTTDGSGLVAQHRLAEVTDLDAAHWFAPGHGAVRGAHSYPLRGVARGVVAPPEGVDPVELRVPTFAELLERVPGMWMTMELKAPGIHKRVADLLATHGRERDAIVGGFDTDRIEAFRSYAPHIATSASQEEAGAFWAYAHGYGDVPDRLPYVALQVPPAHEGVEVVTEPFVRTAHDHGVAVHVWTIDEPSEMHRLLDLGVDAIMTDRPTLLAAVLAERDDG